MGVKRAMVVFESQTGLPEDRVVNTWHFMEDAVAADISTALQAFYNGGGTPVNSLISEFASRATDKAQVRVYDLADAQPRPPTVFPFTLGGTGGTPLPKECAVTLSYYADRSLPRQRGRIYLGPINAGALQNASSDMNVSATARGIIASAATVLMGATPNWCVWSEARQLEQPGGGGNFGAQPVTGGWVDDAVDIQRRRGLKARTRTMWGV